MAETILSMLCRKRILEFSWHPESNRREAWVEEGCDQYFHVQLNKADMLRFAEEIRTMAEGMEDGGVTSWEGY